MVKKMQRFIGLFLALLLLGQGVRAEDLRPITVDDLGFGDQVTKGDPQEQALLHRRSKMLKTHQILGLITAVPMAAALFTSGGAAEGSSGRRELHKNLGMATGALYFTTASFAIFAPEPKNEPPARGATRIHKALAFVHFPAMLTAGILGYQAYRQKDRGEEVHGAAKHHAAAAGVAAGSYAVAMTVMVINF